MSFELPRSAQFSADVLSTATPAPVLDKASLTTSVTGLARASQSLLFVDRSVADYQQLVAGVAPGTEVHVLDSSEDAVTQITNTLLGRQNISSLHIVSHGEAGGLDFGSGVLNLSDLPEYGAQLQSWGNALTADADILLYGCNVAEGELGKAFTSILSQLTGADVAASDDLTGKGGNWNLEFNTGNIETELVFRASAMEAYDASLLNVGYYDMSSGQGVSTQVQPITIAGETPVLLTDLTATDLSNIQVLFVQNPSNSAYGSEYLSRLSSINAAVSNGMVLVIHDRYVANAESILPGVAALGNFVTRLTSDDINIVDGTTLVTNGPGGVLNNASLDNGGSSTHGYAVNVASLPGGRAILSTATLPQAVLFSYKHGSGSVVYGASPLDHFLGGRGNANFRNIYAPNVVAYAASLSNPNPPPILDLNGASAGTGYTASFTEGLGAVALVDSSNLTLTDDGSTIASATVTLSNPLDGTAESLSANAGSTGIAINYNSATGVLNLSGTSSIANYQQILRTVTYNNTSLNPSPTPRTINFIVNDGTVNSTAVTTTLSVTAVNNAPTIAAPASVTVLEDIATAVTGISFTDVDAATGIVTATFSAAAGTLAAIAGSGVTVGGTATDLTLSGTIVNLNTFIAASKLTYKTALDANTSLTLGVTINDNGNTPGSAQTATRSVAIDITPINDQPGFTATNPVASPEDAGVQTLTNWAAFNPGAANEAGQTATYTVSNLSNPSLFLTAPTVAADGTLTYQAAPDAFGTSTFDLLVTDDGGTDNGGANTSTVQTFTITVTPVNDNPTANADSLILAEDSLITSIDVLANDSIAPDINETLTISIVGTPSQGGIAVINNNKIDYKPAANFFGTETFTYAISDGNGGTSNATVTVNVTSVNDAPSFTKGTNQTVTAGDTLKTIPQWATGLSPGAANEAGQTVLYQIVSNSNAALFTVAPTIDSTGTLTYQPVTTIATPTTVTLGVVAQDNGGTANGGADTSTVQTFTITINPQPTLTIADVSIKEGNKGTTPQTFTVRLDTASSRTITVDFKTTDGNATASDGDYAAINGSLTFAPGETQKTITVNINGDIKLERDEFFAVALSNAKNVTVGNTRANGVIQDDDLYNNDASFRQLDFTGDGKADILWRNNTTGETAIWGMDGFTRTSGVYLPPVDSNWRIEAVADFDGNQMGDILWRNYTTQEFAIWRMNGTTMAQGGYLPNLSLDWKIEGTGDFNGDRKDDILLRNAITGENGVWGIDGVQLIETYYLAPIADLNWQVEGIGDFNGDGKADIVWRNTLTNQNAMWQLNGRTILRTDYLSSSPTGWSVEGTGDFNGDGKADILWRNYATGEVALWLMDGKAVTQGAYLPKVDNLNWKIAGTGDFDRDGKADILWRNYSSGENAIWAMDGLAPKATSLINPIADLNWNVG